MFVIYNYIEYNVYIQNVDNDNNIWESMGKLNSRQLVCIQTMRVVVKYAAHTYISSAFAHGQRLVSHLQPHLHTISTPAGRGFRSFTGKMVPPSPQNQPWLVGSRTAPRSFWRLRTLRKRKNARWIRVRTTLGVGVGCASGFDVAPLKWFSSWTWLNVW